MGLVRGSCIDSDDCSHGFWCDPTKSPPIGKKTRYFSVCNRCDTKTLKHSEKVTGNQCLSFYLEDPSKETQLNTTLLALTPVQRAFCDGCYDIVDKGAASVSSYSASAPDGPDLDRTGFELYREIIVARVRSMQTLDWCARGVREPSRVDGVEGTPSTRPSPRLRREHHALPNAGWCFSSTRSCYVYP